MLYAIRQGAYRLRQCWGLVFVVLAVNLALASLLAVPLSNRLAAALENRQAASNMLYGFDTPFWARFSESQSGWAASFSPDILGAGFAVRNLDLLLKGELPARFFAYGPEEEDEPNRSVRPDAVILGLGLVYLVLQTFLGGGILAVLRSPRPSFTIRSLLHGASFYFGRMARVALVALGLAGVVFVAYFPFARWADAQAREAVSESTALVWAASRHLVLLLALLGIHLLSSYAKVIVVAEERSSALLAWLSAAGFCLRRLRPAAGHYLAIVLLGVVLVVLWRGLDGAIAITGYKSQVVALLLMQAFMAARVALRLALLAGQSALYARGDRSSTLSSAESV
jgi:hypothetical protein